MRAGIKLPVLHVMSEERHQKRKRKKAVIDGFQQSQP